jgi:phosphatidylglycerophosphate synthase
MSKPTKFAREEWSITAIRQRLQKRAEAEKLYARLVTRRLSPYITWLILRTPLSANAITALTMPLALAAGYGFSRGEYAAGLWAAAAWQVAYLLDCVDGEVARARRQSSRRGEFLDALAHGISHVAVFAGLLIGHARQEPHPALLAAGTIGGYLLLNLAFVQRTLVFEADPHATAKASPARARSTGVRLLESLTLYPGAMNIFMLAAVLDLLGWAVAVYALIWPLNLAGYFWLRVWRSDDLRSS